MRLTGATLRRVVKADLPIEFVPQQLTSYGGLELLRRYFQPLGLHRRIRQAFSGYGPGGDYGAGRWHSCALRGRRPPPRRDGRGWRRSSPPSPIIPHRSAWWSWPKPRGWGASKSRPAGP